MILSKNCSLLLLAGLLLSTIAFADTGLIKDLDVADTWKHNHNASHWIEQANLRTGVSMYGDVEVPIRSFSQELSGADFIQTALGSKSYTKPVLATFTVMHDVAVYIAHSATIVNKPVWLNAYLRTAFVITSAGGEKFNVYSRRYKAGAEVSLGSNGDTGAPMYMVLVKPASKLVALPTPAGKVFDVLKYGAVGDGKTINTKALQAAIDACTAAGGGSVYVHDGIYMTGTIILKDNVTLHVEAGAILRGSHQPEDYPEIIPSLPSLRRKEPFQLIYAEKATNIGITGGGIIDGYSLGSNRPWNNKLAERRPRLIRMFECKGIKLNHISLMRSCYWTQYYEGCEDMNLTNVRVRCYTGQENQDGIDISGCRNVVLKNFYAITGDDAVCIKSMSAKATENLDISNVFVRYSNCHAVKIGTETHSEIKNVRVNKVVAWARYGTGVEATDGSVVDNVVYENFDIRDCNVPIFITLAQRGRRYEGGPATAPPSKIKNITFRNINNTGVHFDDLHSGPGVASVFIGLPGNEVENVKIENCNLLLYGSLKNPDIAKSNPAENPQGYPEYNMIGVGTAYGLFFRHVRGVSISNTQIKSVYLDARPAIVMDDVKDYKLINVKAETNPMIQPFLMWHRQDGQITPTH